VAGKERLVHGHILDADRALPDLEFLDAVDQRNG
jgi:hypothetical protein